MKYRTLQLFFVFMTIFLLYALGLSEQLVYHFAAGSADAESIAKRLEKPVFYENQFVLSLEQDGWQAENPRETSLGEWDKSAGYFVLYKIPNRELKDISAYGTILKSENDYLLFRSRYEVLNDFEVFHSFKIVRINDRPIRFAQLAAKSLRPAQIQFNAAIQEMVDSVKVDSVWHYIGQLQTMERYTTNSAAMGAANFMRDYYESLGFDTVYFQDYHSGWIPNVIAVKYGTVYPDEIYLAGGHYDAYTTGAPGADDNGSGTAAIMEAARVMSPLNYQRTIKFVSFSGEELGLYGSAAYASQAAQQGENILGMINMDMIAYVQPGDPIDVDVLSNTSSDPLYADYRAACQLYVPTLAIVNGSLPMGASSDHASFWQNGFQAIFPFEDSDHYSPYIHSSQDVLGTSANNQTLAELGTKSVVATLASLAEIAEARITGHVYSAETLAPIPQAQVYYNGDSVQTGAQGSFTTPPLNTGNYELVFTATGFDPDTLYHSLQPYEFFSTDAYLIPEGQTRPYVHLIRTHIDDDSSGSSLGNGNGIPDAGETLEITGNFANLGNRSAENITATIQSSSSWITIHSDTWQVDSVAANDTIASSNAIVVQLNPDIPANTEIPFTVEMNYQGYMTSSSFWLVIHNRGLYLIVEDDDGANGLSPYTAALDSLGISYDVSSPEMAADEMMEYQFMIWFCGDAYSSTITSSDEQKLSTYLDGGGKLFISGVDIGYDIHNDPFYGNYLKATYLGDGPSTNTTLVNGVAGDPISGDFVTGLNIYDNWVDQINPIGGSSGIFTYDYQNTTYTCGLKYDGVYQLVYLTFCYENIPDVNDRRVLMNNIVQWFGIPTGVQNGGDNVAATFSLSPNYPNPFNSETIITFSVPGPERTTLEIYDILGRRVKTLVNEKMVPGVHQAKWNGKNEWGIDVASGLYFYRLKNGAHLMTRKLLLVK